jgi:hypothetical protein
VTDPAAELDGKVTVKVAGDDVAVTRPPFRRLRPLVPILIPLMAAAEPVEGEEDDDEAKVMRMVVEAQTAFDAGEAIAAVLWGDEADTYLDRIMTPEQWNEFCGSAIDALQLGEAVASAKS